MALELQLVIVLTRQINYASCPAVCSYRMMVALLGRMRFVVMELARMC